MIFIKDKLFQDVEYELVLVKDADDVGYPFRLFDEQSHIIYSIKNKEYFDTWIEDKEGELQQHINSFLLVKKTGEIKE